MGFHNATILTIPPGSSLSAVATVPTTSGGDALFAFYNADEVTTPLTKPSDFTQIDTYRTSTYDNNTAGIWSYTANGGAGFPSSGGPTTYTFTAPAQVFPSTSLLLMSWTGLGVTPTDAQPTVINAQHITPTGALSLNGVTAAAGDEILIFIAGDAISSASDVFSATATGYTQKANGGDGFSPVIVLASSSTVSAGATGAIPVSITSVPSGEDFGGLIAWVVAMPASGGGGIGPLVGDPVMLRAAMAPRRAAAPVDVLPKLAVPKAWSADSDYRRQTPVLRASAPIDVLPKLVVPKPWSADSAPSAVGARPSRAAALNAPLPALPAGSLAAWSGDTSIARLQPPSTRASDAPLPALAATSVLAPIVDGATPTRSARAVQAQPGDQVFSSLGVKWAPDVLFVRAIPVAARVLGDAPFPAVSVLPTWAGEGPPNRAQAAQRRPWQDVPLPGIAVLAALAWAPEGPTSRALPVPRRAGQDVPLPSIAAAALAWAPEAQPSRARPVQARAVQDTTLPAVRIALPWVPDAVQVRVQATARAQPADPLVFAPLLADVVIDTQQMRVQSAPRRIEQAADTLPPIAGLLIAWAPDVYYPRQAKGTSSYYAGVYVLPGLVATLIRPASGPQHRTAYGVRTRTAQEKPRTRTAYGAPRNRIAR